ncbi:hypothetical protein [Persicobacter psychrovividus]|uniref:Uncharacterized protein n=1 Tax=Persicobacter psychrovividus TaxID=387638 RepID=A0ABM7VDQ3_9BACT|nr:hypothetical protein PEPS_13610 [Persicobacter psychrovividus]
MIFRKMLPVAYGAVIAMCMASCQEAIQPATELTATTQDSELRTMEEGMPSLQTAYDINYVAAGDYYSIVGEDANGDLSVFFGDRVNGWTRLQDKYAKNAIWGDYLATSYDDESGNFLYAFMHNGKVAVNGGYQFGGKPRYNSGKSYVGSGADCLVEFLDLDYVHSAGYWVISGKNASGKVLTFVGKQRAWTQLPDKQSASNAWGEFLASAFNQVDAGEKFEGVYAYLFPKNGTKYVVTNGLREFYGKPWFNSGKRFVGTKGDRLTSLINLDYVPSMDAYIIQGMSESGNIDTYFGSHKNGWVKTEDRHSAGKLAGKYVDIAVQSVKGGKGFGINYLLQFGEGENGKVNVGWGKGTSYKSEAEILDKFGNVIGTGGLNVRHYGNGVKVEGEQAKG